MKIGLAKDNPETYFRIKGEENKSNMITCSP
jgi:hypothetical protein